MKKTAAAAILVLVLAGSAMAAPGWGVKCRPGGGMPMGYGQQILQNASPELKAKMDERAKLYIDLRAELRKDIPNKAKARDIHEKIQAEPGDRDGTFRGDAQDPSNSRHRPGAPDANFLLRTRHGWKR